MPNVVTVLFRYTAVVFGGFQHGPYDLPNFRYNGVRICTNKPYCGAMRGHGGVQVGVSLSSLRTSVCPSKAAPMNAVEPEILSVAFGSAPFFSRAFTTPP